MIIKDTKRLTCQRNCLNASLKRRVFKIDLKIARLCDASVVIPISSLFLVFVNEFHRCTKENKGEREMFSSWPEFSWISSRNEVIAHSYRLAISSRGGKGSRSEIREDLFISAHWKASYNSNFLISWRILLFSDTLVSRSKVLHLLHSGQRYAWVGYKNRINGRVIFRSCNDQV